jgi:hypothetical protein
MGSSSVSVVPASHAIVSETRCPRARRDHGDDEGPEGGRESRGRSRGLDRLAREALAGSRVPAIEVELGELGQRDRTMVVRLPFAGVPQDEEQMGFGLRPTATEAFVLRQSDQGVQVGVFGLQGQRPSGGKSQG